MPTWPSTTTAAGGTTPSALACAVLMTKLEVPCSEGVFGNELTEVMSSADPS